MSISYKDVVKEIKRKLQPSNLEYESYEVFEKRKVSNNSIQAFFLNFIRNYIDKISYVQNIALQSQMIMIWNDLDILINKLRDLEIFIKSTNYQGTTFSFIKESIRKF